ncbi:MAG: hypothetical protein ABIR70_11080 [Bryobacteraceae bacterium]
MVLYEFASVKKEYPDVIGWSNESSTLIECKSSRADFLRDAQKPIRKNPKSGMGHRRYYLCPTGIIKVEDLPPRWGLLWAEKSHISVQREAKGYPARNLSSEVRFLASMLRRAQIRVGSRPLSEWLRGENQFEAVRGVSPNRKRA